VPGGAAAWETVDDDGRGGGNADAADGRVTSRGFDRLRMLGLDDEDVTVLRAMYLPEALERMAPLLPRGVGEPHSAYVQRLEEAWMLQQGEDSEFIANLRPRLAARGITMGDGARRMQHGGGGRGGEHGPGGGVFDDYDGAPQHRQEEADGTLLSFAFAFMLGFTLGILSVFILMCSRSTRDGGWLTRKARLGLLVGIAANAALSLYLSDGADARAGGGTDGGASGGASGGGTGGRTFDFLDLLGDRPGYAPVDVGALPAGRRLRG
jgi:hypothetical protein